MLSLVEKQVRNSSDSKRKTKTKLRSVPLRPLVQLRPLSAEELCQVNLATFREGFNHCRWPKDVIEKLLTVQV